MLAVAPVHSRRHPRDYDHRIRNAVVAAADPALFAGRLHIPGSTARSWIARGVRHVVTLEQADHAAVDLQVQIARLDKKVARLHAILALLLALLRCGLPGLGRVGRLPDRHRKRILLRAIDRARRSIPLAHALRVLRISPARYHAWTARELRCALDDAPSCPRTRPTRLSARERFAIQVLAKSPALAHLSTRALALFAQRHDLVHATATTWYRLVRERGWHRPRVRIHPRPPKEGIRADRPGQFLHVDVTVFRLLDGSRAVAQAVIDNYSRMILAFAVTTSYDGSLTADLLRKAFDVLQHRVGAVLFTDDGRENHGRDLDRALDDTGILQLIAQGHVTFSNSMIEAFWRSMKHGFLFMQRLDSFATLDRFIAFYVEQHNTTMPHAAFRGQTPEEVFYGRGDHVPDELASMRQAARMQRIADNRRLHCQACPANAPPTGHVP